MIGGILVKVAFALALASSFLYYRVSNGAGPRELDLARKSFHGAVMLLLSAVAVLLYLILTHQFQYTYVWEYSSTDLSLPLLISTFYAGQQGSFTLWALYTSIIGVFLLRYSSRKDYEAEVMSIFSLILSFLLLMIVVKNPFEYIWNAFPQDLIQTGPIPAGFTNFVMLDSVKGIWARYPVEGKGLNPLLQNYWMVIHPQVLFLGFSSMAVPYSMAVAGLRKRDYNSWIRIATPWAVFGAMVLGTGIILGGYWAYETLGWGGFWGWDPVENSSLIPWLLCVASIHTTLTQRQSGAFVRTNFVLSLLTFILVLYSTFLTRSGVLGETSVHSFVDPGNWVYWLLLSVIFIFGGIGFGLLFRRMKEMPKVPVEHSIFSREFALFLGATALTFVAVFCVVGTSSPIITSIVNGKASAVDTIYYVRTNLPLGIVIAFLSGLGQLLWWKHSKTNDLLKRMIVPLIGGAIATVAVLTMGAETFEILLFVFFAGFSLVANLVVGYDVYIGNPKFVGGSIAHIGIALLCLGFVTSSRYDKKATVSLEQNVPLDTLGYRLTYVKDEHVGKFDAFRVRVEKDGRTHVVSPTMYYSEFAQSVMRHPDLINYLNRDLYVAPLSLEDPQVTNDKTLTLQKGESTQVGPLTVKFDDFDFSATQMGQMLEGKGFQIRGIMEVTEGYQKKKVDLVMKNSGEGPEYLPANLVAADGKNYVLQMVRLLPDKDDRSKSKIEFTVKMPLSGSQQPHGETLVVEASIKPYINLVWMGTITLAIGFFLTILRRVEEAKLKMKDPE